MKIRHSEPHGPLRAKEYPNKGDQLDAIYKGFKALKQQGFEFPDETSVWLEEIERVKSTYPKRS